MSYEDFVREYHRLVKLMIGYGPDEAGSVVYAEKLSDLVDKYPEYENRLDNDETDWPVIRYN